MSRTVKDEDNDDDPDNNDLYLVILLMLLFDMTYYKSLLQVTDNSNNLILTTMTAVGINDEAAFFKNLIAFLFVIFLLSYRINICIYSPWYSSLSFETNACKYQSKV